MMRKIGGASLFVMVVVVAILFLGEVPDTAEGVTCSPTELAPCAQAFSSSAPPSNLCCQKVREQRPCLCGYIKNPALRQYVNSPGARKVSSACGVPIPSC
ncbi:Non-specific lipid-transfer protein [Quillaja saponaria]|uniref:Non-specific lipid-transfer protein n=1 Tax=Quillaja saponaria TaxID=32244 RepID=A0AAD7VD30_QUISA|nr:Non-specific lipid-transfer protein [Quillaja saponaria]